MWFSDKDSERKVVSGRRQVLQGLGLVGGSIVAATVAHWPLTAAAETSDKSKSLIRVGEFSKVYDPSIGEKQHWYINDHTFIRAEDGKWHLFGITHKEPANAQQEKFFAHATASDLMGPWTKQAPVMQVDEKVNETVVWAPYVLRHNGVCGKYGPVLFGSRHDDAGEGLSALRSIR
jgi:arabinan endo-1,5-alpha-L-arabinosidase